MNTPVPPDRTDYHVHCHFDGCAAKDMTLANPAWGHTLAQHDIVEKTIQQLGVTCGALANWRE